MSMCVMSASAALTAGATCASTPLPLLHQHGDGGLERARQLLGPVDAHPALAVALEQAACRRCTRRCAPSGPRRGRGSRRSSSPGIGRQQAASCTDAPSLPSITTTPCVGARVVGGVAAHRQRQRRRAACRARPAACASRLATMVAILRPRPMSIISSARLRLPLQRVSCCHSAACVGRLVGRAAVRPSARSACASSFSPRSLRLLLLHVLQVVADLRARAAGAHEVQPGRVRPRAGRGDDLDDVAAAQLGAQRHRLAVDLGRDAVVADVGVDRVGEVDRRRAARQRQDLASSA